MLSGEGEGRRHLVGGSLQAQEEDKNKVGLHWIGVFGYGQALLYYCDRCKSCREREARREILLTRGLLAFNDDGFAALGRC